MKIRLQADNDLHEDILRSAKRLQPAINFQRAPELGLHTGIDDPEVLRLAPNKTECWSRTIGTACPALY